jgi:poly(ADP-ribose) glycohydrolase ARH3
MIDLEKKFLGGMIGSALGDAIGEMAFMMPLRERLEAVIQEQPKLRYTDDTAMAIGLAQSLLEKGRIDQEHLGKTFSDNFDREPWRGYASGPPTIFSEVKQRGMPYVVAAEKLFGETGSFGNGAAMRIAPLGLFYHASRRLYDEACQSAQVTHAHPVGMDGAAVQAGAVAQAVGLDPDEVFPRGDYVAGVVNRARTAEIHEKMRMVQEMLQAGADPKRAANAVGRSVAVQESMPFALYAFLRNPKSFRDCLFCAILHGGDRDTLGAMACAISGAYLGIDAIPVAWQTKLENRAFIETLAKGLAKKAST